MMANVANGVVCKAVQDKECSVCSLVEFLGVKRYER